MAVDSTPTSDSWEEEFDEKFPPGYFFRGSDRNPIKSFIKEVVASQRKEIADKIRQGINKALKKRLKDGLSEAEYGYEEAMNYVLSALAPKDE